MATGAEVLSMLIPTGGWVISGDDFDSIVYDEDVIPITKAAYEAGFAEFDDLKSQEKIAKAEEKAALLERLGITELEAALLLS
jgi:hypothetical protein